MKIQGPNPLFNAYKNKQQKQIKQKSEYQKDQLKISEEAKKLQQNEKQIERSNYVANIKQLVQSGNYKVENDKTAQKMIQFWTNRV